MSGHTPGPWHLTFGESGWFEVATPASVDGMGRMLITSRSSINHRAGESVANARLIAAAPDLLAACEAWANAEQCRAYIPERERADWDALIGQAKAAVLMAKGGVR